MSSVAKLPHTLSAQLRVASGGANSLCGVALQQFGRSYKLVSWQALNGFKAKLGDLSLSSEAIPLGSCDAKY